ncbi:hypothetical protein HYFRA_00009964 [Hymenoscyphus fraxineus]|uniref:Uncharacterized protein n=1 Tax=Hymenoscyphus fraxineus TaxID=746836 RepID=A0A9N9L7Y8_9HELO|nr:hypothetical protein HYFRA_00009964 [Hymenoscyphus fraxineus]
MLSHLEAYLTSRLLASPSFHRLIRTVHKKVHEIQHGRAPSYHQNPSYLDPSPLNTKIEKPSRSHGQFQKFVENYREELRSQFWGSKRR